ncbi:transporter substrate-binding domain-containing protein [Neisseria sp. Ec49-e6-T10]|uniref:transporter substrate-binding domain-containing protein n=1 Tax=Neisseria sp. Ec49-e6-T10 TaxID=3140744 RepID=UPI003EBB85E9
MKKQIYLLTCLLTLFSQVSYARSWAQIQETGLIKIGVPADYAPLAFYSPEGQLVGYDIDMANQLGHALNLKVEFIQTSWPTLSEDLLADKFDVAMGGVTATEKRAQQFALSNPVVKNGKVALANCNQAKKYPTLKTIDQSNVRVIVNPGGTNQSYVDQHIKQAHVIRTQDNFANLQGLRDQTADIMFTDLIEADYYQVKEPGILCLATPEVLDGTASHKVYMLSKDNTDLLRQINQWLRGPTKSNLAKKWQLSE